jgi:hypothetical protein
MDELARRYVLLCLRLERVAPGLIDSYVGPPELSELVAAEEPLPAVTLHDEALALRALVAEWPDITPVRARWLDGQLRAIAVLARRAGGEEIAYLDLVEQLYGVPIAPTPEAELEAARDRVDRALTGNGSLAERVDAHRRALRVPPERVLQALIGSADRFRTATKRAFDLPEPEGIDWGEAHDQPWGAYAEFSGNSRTRIDVNVDLPLEVTGIAFLAAHEAYPGHHAEHITKERTLIAAGVGEATMRTMGTPEAMLAEGMADVAGEVIMTDPELAEELARIGADVGVAGDWHAAVALYHATLDLNPAMANAAYMLHHLGRSHEDVRAWVEATVPRPDWIDHLMRAATDETGRTHVFTYTEGVRLIRRWLAVTGPRRGFARLLSEQLSPGQLLAELGEGT